MTRTPDCSKCCSAKKGSSYGKGEVKSDGSYTVDEPSTTRSNKGKCKKLGMEANDDMQNGRSYLIFLPQVPPEFLEAAQTPPSLRRSMSYQHVGALPHYGIHIHEKYLNVIFRQRWIGCGGSVHWLARSPDLSCMEFIWGHMKSLVYDSETKWQSMELSSPASPSRNKQSVIMSDLSDMKSGTTIRVRLAKVSVSRTANLIGVSRTTVSRAITAYTNLSKVSSVKPNRRK
ncbi:hypothetical protein TNCV_3177681 [Trichonephila clavipes]|nr:hypothetical protein TNCV_3177681 [Trichonephila clavipes]